MQEPLQFKEQELLSRVAMGDEKAFEQLFNTFHQSLGSHVYAITKSLELTEEIVQDCFLKVWITRENLTEIKNFRTWLFVLSRNAAISAFRKNVAHQVVSQGEFPDDIQRWDDVGAEKEKILSLIDEAIKQLTPRQKEVFRLSRYKNMKYAEVAKVMGLSKLTVKEHMKQAMISIRRYVKEHGTDLPMLLVYFFLKK